MTIIHLVTAEHFHVPGLIQKAFATREAANVEAAEIVAIMLKDSPMTHRGKPTPDAWEMHLAALQDYHGAAHCYVEVSALTVEG